MKKFMNIYDILRAPDGRAVIAGTDPNYELPRHPQAPQNQDYFHRAAIN
jgi:hypothetical protein